jgi:hypothetical protein
MPQQPDDHRNRVLAHFERCRAVAGAPFEEGRFLDFLLASPSGDRAAYNSFAGLRRLNRFIEAVQLEFSVCFSMDDRDKNYGLEPLIARIRKLEASKQSSLASLRNREKHRFGWFAVIFGNLLAFPIWMLAFKWHAALGSLVVAACAVATGLAVRLYVHDKRYLRRLRAQIERAGPDSP